MLQIGQKKCLLSKKDKITKPQTYVISDHNGEEIAVRFRKRIAKSKSKKSSELKKKVIKSHDDKLCVKQKGYDCHFNSWIDKKDILI